MASKASQKEIEAAGLSFILGMKIPQVPYVVARWRHEHPGEDIPDGHVFTQPWPAGPNGGRRDQVIYYQYRHDRARRTLRGIDEQITKAEQAIAGKAEIKRNRFIQLSGGTKTINRELEAGARAQAGAAMGGRSRPILPRCATEVRGLPFRDHEAHRFGLTLSGEVPYCIRVIPAGSTTQLGTGRCGSPTEACQCARW
jgi:hypothetical protein